MIAKGSTISFKKRQKEEGYNQRNGQQFSAIYEYHDSSDWKNPKR